MGADGQGPFAGCLHARLAMVAGQTHQAQTGAIALFRMFLLDQEALDQFGGGGADRCRPSLQLARRPLGMRPMSGRHVLGQRGVMPLPTAAGMAGDALAFGQHFDHVTRNAQLDGLMDQGMRHAVVIALKFDVVVDVDRSFLPLGNDEGRHREGRRYGASTWQRHPADSPAIS